MGLAETVKDILKGIPLSEVLRERLAGALDYSAKLEAENEALRKSVAVVQAKLEIEQEKHGETRAELQRLKDEHAEDVRIHRSIELRRGKRTNGEWAPFCPKCHMPLGFADNDVFCSGQCEWLSDLKEADVSVTVRRLNQQ